MKKELVALALSVFIIAFLATPASAVPSMEKKTPVTQWSSAGTAVHGEGWVTNGNLSFNHDTTVVHPDSHLSIDGAPALIGTSSNTYNEMLQFDRVTGGYNGSKGINHYVADWNYPPQGSFAGGGFTGIINAKYDDFTLYVILRTGLAPLMYYTMHMEIGGVLHGYGAFEGQMLQIGYNGFYDVRYSSNMVWEGYLFG